MNKLPPQVCTALRMLGTNGYEAYIVGGCVRDSLLGRIPSDYDITTNALPDQTQKVFEHFKCIDIGKAHGTIAVLINGMQIEITTYRIDGEYKDKRHPESVRFTPRLRDDLSRRDFTINALAYNESFGLADFFGGREDLEKKLIRCVGEPAMRFEEDALRIMRAVRFASQLGFGIEDNTKKSILALKNTLSIISAERLRTELEKLINGPFAFDILMSYHSVLCVFIPELTALEHFDQHSKYHRYDVWEHTVRAVCSAPYNRLARITMLFHDVAKPLCFTLDSSGSGHFRDHPEKGAQVAQKILRRLKYDNATTDSVCLLIRYHDHRFKNKADIKRILRIMGEELFFTLLVVQQADADAKDGQCTNPINNLSNVKKTAESVISNGECYRICDMEINGTDIKNLGAEGPEIGKTLNMLLEQIINEKIENKKEVLISAASELISR
ncbi:MAG: HD domain-containing protein [Oscillospiraceae bacterium]|nr:HD domain-containing protein [Oscillospiraceae bacterium]